MTARLSLRSRWRRWWRSRRHARSGPLVLAAVALLVGFDQATKSFLVTQEGYLHASPPEWTVMGLVLIVVLAPFTLRPSTRIPAVLALSGATANVLSQLIHNTNHNPIFVQTTTHGMAFNIADLYMVSAIATAGVFLALSPRRQP